LARLEELQRRQSEFLERPLLCTTELPKRQMLDGEPERNCGPSSTTSSRTDFKARRFAGSSFASGSLSVRNNLHEVFPDAAAIGSRT